MSSVRPPANRSRRRLLTLLLAAGAIWVILAFLLPVSSSSPAATDTAAGSNVATVAGTTLHTAVDAALVTAAETADADLVATTDNHQEGAEEALPDFAGLQPEEPEPYSGPPLPRCEYGSQPAPLASYDDWRFTLLDTTYHLSSDYVPPDLVNLAQLLTGSGLPADTAQAGHQLRHEAATELGSMFSAAEAAGVHLAVQSAYRSYAYQQTTFDYWVQLNGLEAALQTSARAGHSEHQLGTAVDLRSRNGPAAWDLEDWAATPEGAWVQQNAHRYGFVMSYPSGSELDSCYAYEPWHFRYVGPNVAEQIIESGLTPRQFLWQFMNQYRLPDLQIDNEEMGSEDS